MSRAPPPLRVLHVVSGDLWAGAEVQVATLLSKLATNPDVEVHAAVLNSGELADRLAEAGIRVTVLDEGHLSAMEILAKLRELIRKFDVDIVHTHRVKENVIGGLAARLEGHRPSLRTVHGAPESRARFWRADKRLISWLDDWSSAYWQQASVAVSDDLGRKLRARTDGARVEVIHNGLDVSAFESLRARRTGRSAAGMKRIAFVGRLVPVKRVDLFLAMADRLLARGVGHWQFEIVGDGPLQAILVEQASKLGIAESVCFRGFRPDAVDVLSGCDALVFTSDHEGTPMAALEALALGVPIVARAVGGLVELLEDLPGCRLVGSDLPDALADAVESAVKDDVSREIRLPDRYHIEVCARKYLELYRRLARP